MACIDTYCDGQIWFIWLRYKEIAIDVNKDSRWTLLHPQQRRILRLYSSKADNSIGCGARIRQLRCQLVSVFLFALLPLRQYQHSFATIRLSMISWIGTIFR